MPWAAQSFKGEGQLQSYWIWLQHPEKRFVDSNTFGWTVSLSKKTEVLTQSRSRPGAVRQAETPELCDASPTDRRCHRSSRTLVLKTSISLQTRSSSEPRLGSDRQICHETWCVSCLTSFVTVLKSLCDPLNGFSCNLGAEVSIKRGRSTTLWYGKKRFC